MLTDKSPFYKRLSAFLIDLFIILVSALFLDVLITKPCFNQFGGYNETQKNLLVERVKSYLFVVIDKNYEIVFDGDSLEEDILNGMDSNKKICNIRQFVSLNENVGSETYLKYLTSFYTMLDINILDTMKIESHLFEGDNFIEGVSEEDKITFCDNVFKKADKDILLYKDGIIVNLTHKISTITVLSNVINYGVTSFIFLWLIPVLSKYRQSIGKRFMKLSVVNKFYVPANIFVLSARYLSLMLIEVLLSLFILYIPLIASCIMVLVLKNGNSIHDFLSTSQVVDLESFTPFDSLKDYQDYINKEKEALDKSLRRPYEK